MSAKTERLASRLKAAKENLSGILATIRAIEAELKDAEEMSAAEDTVSQLHRDLEQGTACAISQNTEHSYSPGPITTFRYFDRKGNLFTLTKQTGPSY